MDRMKLLAVELFVVLLAMFAVGALLPGDVQAGHSHQGGTCTSGATACRTNFSGGGTALNVRMWDQFSGTVPAWLTAAQAAVTSWNNFGPFQTSWGSQSNDTWDYLKVTQTGSVITGGGVSFTMMSWDWGVTKRCRQFTLTCTTLIGVATNTHWAEVYLNKSVAELDPNNASFSVFYLQWVFAHEIGHGFGLAHHTQDPLYLMREMKEYPGAANGPTNYPIPGVPGDMGTLPRCTGGAANYGIRCIYGWTQ